jgi:hypothetical protein
MINLKGYYVLAFCRAVARMRAADCSPAGVSHVRGATVRKMACSTRSRFVVHGNFSPHRASVRIFAQNSCAYSQTTT